MLWGREVDLPDGLFLQPVLRHIFRNLGSCGKVFDGCEPLPVAPGAIIGLRQLWCQTRIHHYVSLSIPTALAISNRPQPQERAAAQLFPGGWSGLPEPLQPKRIAALSPHCRARGTFARYRSLCGPEGRHHVSSCGGRRSGWPRALQSKALPAIPSWLYISDIYYLCSKKIRASAQSLGELIGH